MNEPNSKNIFERIIDREIPADIVYEDDESLAFRDINPQAPTHLLVIPKQPISSLEQVESEHRSLLGHLLYVARVVAEQQGLASGYRVVINCGDDGGQEVPHLHLHVLGARQMKWPPG
mgnify:CR=1 FL=1